MRRSEYTTGTSLRHLWHDDVMWTVYERTHGARDGQSTRLIFEQAMAVRTLRLFPADWAALSDDELYALSLKW